MHVIEQHPQVSTPLYPLAFFTLAIIETLLEEGYMALILIGKWLLLPCFYQTPQIIEKIVLPYHGLVNGLMHFTSAPPPQFST